ncbi:hypothetical protein [Fusobacterium pseudoperiodonticum]|uniref:Uncharacterized protein n=1 Tax=Fusobacterium pseudoperiodonticum TaxID=2663009 RepID=A0A2D3NSS3_9FUSO|nr:hypothetical protein [Fusobacterium pseudoperiodonticum]ATV58400.1 hypothetical protein CTM72_00780 [Fusobacterium pseudoperiodonticum]
MNKDFDNNIHILTKKKESLKVILILFLIFLAFLGLEIYYESLSEFIVMTAIFASILLVWLTILAINIYSITKIVKYRDNTVVPDEFQISSPKHIFMLIILIIFSVYIIPQNIMDPSENVFQKIKYPICLIIIFIGIYRIYKDGRYSINIMKKNIKILFKNQEISYFNVENIAFVKFSRTKKKATFFLLGNLIIGFFRNKEKSGNYPLMQLFDFKGKEFFRFSLSIKDYWLMKKYFLKYNVKTEDLCDFLNDDLS